MKLMKCSKCGCEVKKPATNKKSCICDKCSSVKETLTFKQFLSILDEDLGGDVAKLQGDIAMIDTQIAQKTNPLVQQKQRLQKMLALKQKQKEVEDKKLQQQQQQQGTKPSVQPQQDIQSGT